MSDLTSPELRLNTLRPAAGSRTERTRQGRGIGSGKGRTGGRGDKGQKSRSGGYHKVGFEGGQMPLQRRLPKRGFRSSKSGRTAELRLHELGKVDAEIIDSQALKAQGLVSAQAERVKVIASGELNKAVRLQGLAVTKGARAAIEAAGGTIEGGAAPAGGKNQRTSEPDDESTGNDGER